jgi:hypothetical protein
VPNLTQAWTRVPEASKPNGEHAQGEGDYPEGALFEPGAKLNSIRPDPNG